MSDRVDDIVMQINSANLDVVELTELLRKLAPMFKSMVEDKVDHANALATPSKD